jgi:putative endopeptidase
MFRSLRVLLALLLVVTAIVFDARAEDGVDAGVKPGDDFFAYANGDWLRATAIPPGKSRWSARNEIAERATEQVTKVIRDAPAGNVARFRDAYLDEAGIERKGLSPIAPLLKGIEGVKDKAALARWLGAQLRADVDPLNVGVFDSPNLFGFAAQFGIHGEPNNIAYLLQGGLGLTNRDAYLDDSAAKLAARMQYRDHIARLLKGAGFDKAMERAQAVLALETKIARTHATAEDSGKETNADNRWRRTDFASQAPGLDWPIFFAAAGLSKQTDIVVWQPGAIKGSAALVASEPLSVWKDYLRFHVMHRYADVLPNSIAEPSQLPREQRAIDVTNQAMSDAVGRLYVERYFPKAAKDKVQSIVDHVLAAFTRRVEAAPWMTAQAKGVALAKLKVLYFGVAFPDQWPDDSKLRIDAHDAVGNLQRVAEWSYRNALAKLGKPVDRREWAIPVQDPGGVLNFQLNTYNFAAALLQAPRFDASASDAANYGSIGVIFAHEISHFVDTLGAEYDAKGDTRTWWTAVDKAKFAAATQPLIDQYSAYRPFTDLAVDGKLTLVENVADLAGVATAFDAYREAVGSKAADNEALRRMDREFFIGFARSWRSKLNDEAMRARILGDGHAPDRYHVFTVRNVDAWYEAFDVRPGQALYLEPGARVRIW